MTDSAGWKDAGSLRELRALTASWLRGEVDGFPGYASSPASETQDILDPLIRLNESGLLTTNSQPAGVGESWKQRAYVEGFAAEEDARRIATKALYSDLHILAFPPGSRGGYMTPVTVVEGQPMTWNGRIDHSTMLSPFENRCSESGLDDLRQAWIVVAIDLRWGRKNHLWKVLLDGGAPISLSSLHHA